MARNTSNPDRIDIEYDYAVCAWARHFNVSEKRVKEAVAAVGDSADKVREHLGAGVHSNAGGVERPSGR
ncbi:MAG: hypothetical protein JWQ07_4191 [Ramlibacter sp.]|nr:hypothetical protein [Ramlibacter sp.]